MYLDRLAQIHPAHHPIYSHGPGAFARRHNRLGGMTSDYRHSAILGSTMTGAGRSVTPLPNVPSALTKEQRNAELAKTYEAALQKSVAMKGKARTDGATPHVHTSSEGAARPEEVQSELGDSYIDGGAAHAPRSGLDDERNIDELEADELANGGVMGLLTQIYDRRGRGL